MTIEFKSSKNNFKDTDFFFSNTNIIRPKSSLFDQLQISMFFFEVNFSLTIINARNKIFFSFLKIDKKYIKEKIKYCYEFYLNYVIPFSFLKKFHI